MGDIEVTVRVSGETAIVASTNTLTQQSAVGVRSADSGGVPIRITIQGLALWIDRGGFYDVLFPNDERVGQRHHYVTWGVPELPSSDLIVDLRGAGWIPSDNSSFSTERWLSLEIEKGSAADDPTGVLTNRGACVGVLRLPYGRISHNHVKFYCKYSVDNRYYWLSSFVDWEGTLASANMVQAMVTDRATGVGQPTPIAAREFVIKCLSDKDRQTKTGGGVNLDTTDFNVLAVLTKKTGKGKLGIVTWNGEKHPDPRTAPFRPNAFMTTDEKFCPSVSGYTA
jgi:hypothetical protein